MKMVDEQFIKDGRELFILIDRIDVIWNVEKEPQKFVDSFQRLNNACKSLRIILTSGKPAFNQGLLMGKKEKMMEVWVDTTKPSQMELS